MGGRDSPERADWRKSYGITEVLRFYRCGGCVKRKERGSLKRGQVGGTKEENGHLPPHSFAQRPMPYASVCESIQLRVSDSDSMA